MNQQFTNNDRINFIEQAHQEFLFMKGYGSYAYISSHDVNELFDAYRLHQHGIESSITRHSPEVGFIRSYIKSLSKSGPRQAVSTSGSGMEKYQDL